MIVSELIEILKDMHPDAIVLLPMENGNSTPSMVYQSQSANFELPKLSEKPLFAVLISPQG